MELNLKGRVALVTGAAGGIGAAIAAALAAEGCVVYLGDSNADAAGLMAASLGSACHALAMDVADAPDARRAVQRIVSEQGRIDILVNNAGILKTGSVVEATIRDWDEVCRVNLSGVYYCCKAALPAMLERRAGKIINMASVSAFKGGGALGNVLYGATKAGVVALTKGFARELAPFGINVNAIAPAVTETAMTNPLLTPGSRDAVLAAIPLGRFASTAEIGQIAAFLASDASGYITGETIAVDGGYLTR